MSPDIIQKRDIRLNLLPLLPRLRKQLANLDWDNPPPAPDNSLHSRFLSLFSTAVANEREKIEKEHQTHHAKKSLVAASLLNLAAFVKASVRLRACCDVLTKKAENEQFFKGSRKRI